MFFGVCACICSMCAYACEQGLDTCVCLSVSVLASMILYITHLEFYIYRCACVCVDLCVCSLQDSVKHQAQRVNVFSCHSYRFMEVY